MTKSMQAQAPQLRKPGARARARVNVLVVARDFGMSAASLSRSLGLKPQAPYAGTPARPLRDERRLRVFLEIIGRVEPWAGGPLQALSWYRGQKIPALGNETAESLVRQGKAAMVQAYLDAFEAGGYA